MYRLFIQPPYSIEDIYLASINQNQNHFIVKWRRLGTPRFLMKMPVQETCFMSTALISQIGLGLKNTLAINANVERHALLYRSVKCGVLILAERKRPGVPSLQIHPPLSGPAPHDALAIKMVPRVCNMILDNSAIRPGASYRALACMHIEPRSNISPAGCVVSQEIIIVSK